MANTYRALLHGNILEWLNGRPDSVGDDESVEVDVTLLNDESDTAHARGKRMAASLEQLANLPSSSLPKDAADWEREVRADRSLPGRDGGC